LIFCQFTIAAQVQSNCQVPALLKQTYSRDIAAMAMERLYTLQSPDTAQFVIHQTYRDTILAGLAAILNTGSQLEADSIFMMHCIHVNYPAYFKDYLQVTIDTQTYWAKKWEKNDLNTGYGALDTFMKKYGFSITSYYPKYPVAYVTLKTDSAINTTAAIDSFKQFSGIYNAEIPPVIFQQGDYISYKRDTASHFIFYMTWSHCFNCLSYKAWHYTVTDDCIVTLDSTYVPMGNYGWRLPYNCNLQPLALSITTEPSIFKADIYPNPVKDKMQIKATGNNSYLLYDILGRQLKSEHFTEKTSADFSTYAPGVYFIEVRNSSGALLRKKIIKQ
jgi:hypothetical protein